MNDESSIHRETLELLDLDADQGLNPGQAERLAHLLSEHPEALDLYIEYTDQSAALQNMSGQNLSIGQELVTRIENGLDAEEPTWKPPVWKPWIAAASIAIAAGILFFSLTNLNRNPNLPTNSTATLARAVNAHWTLGTSLDAPTIRLQSGDRLPEGRIHLSAGMAQVTFDSGTSLILEAPAEFEVRGNNAGFLHQGRATARVPEKAQGFILDTPALHVVDLGTEFALSANASGLTDVMVIKGEIEVNLPGAPIDAEPIRLLENHALRADRTIGTLESIETDNLPAFRRTLPSDVSLRPEATGHDWNSAANWDDNLPTSIDKDYHISGDFSQAIDTPVQGDTVFGGRSLHIDRGGILRLHNNGGSIIRINDLRLDRSTLKHIPAGRTLKLSGNLTLDGNAVIDLIDNSGRVFEIDSEIHSVEGVPSRILIRQAPKRRRFSTPRDGEGKFSDSIVRVLKANNDFHDAWQVDGGILEAAAPDALGRAALVIASNGRLDLGGHDHTLRAATINGEKLETGLHTFKALKARFPKHILGEGGSLTISQ